MTKIRIHDLALQLADAVLPMGDPEIKIEFWCHAKAVSTSGRLAA
jgi:hypothetical protein